jgi:UDP-N-acetylmuramate: L-alanyl-gamma-D-glutamyl-meso-diaminopimelate ligase
VKVYFLGIAGAGMSALASILASEGHAVEGSDDGVFPPVTTYLESLGIPYHVGFDARRVPPDIDAAIIGSSAKLDLAHNPELAELIRRGAPRFSFPAFLGRHLAGRDTVVVAGSFGKSTVTALLATILTEAGGDPGYFIGAVPLDLPMTGRAGTDAVFVMEGDEYIVGGDDHRSKFMLYDPRALLITSLIHDHVNVFPTMADYEAPFAALIEGLPPDAPLVCARPFAGLRRLTAGRSVVWYGREPGDGYHADTVRIGETTRFDLVTPAGERIPLETGLLGLHNIENIVGACAMLLTRGDVGAAALRRGVRRFRGVARRLDKKTSASAVPAYEGFGSSYEKARSAIEAILLHFPARPCVVVFEPHAFSWRDPAAIAWYDTVFAGVARVLLLPPPGHGAAGARLTQGQIAARILAAGVPVTALEDGPAVIGALGETLAGEEVILLLSSGPLDGLPVSLPPWLEARFPPPRSAVSGGLTSGS